MTTSPDRPIRKFNPGLLQSDSELIEQFVVRQGELDIVLETLRGNIASPSCQHALLVAPRGQGKTMLLARIAVELQTDENLSAHLFPVRFMEESLEIFTLADFWLEALFHLARETEASCPELSQELRQTRDDLTGRYNETLVEDQALATLVDAADRLGKQLVLMVENLQALSRSVDDDFGWKLRKVLQCEPQNHLARNCDQPVCGIERRESTVLRVLPYGFTRAARHHGVPTPVGDGQWPIGSRAGNPPS